MNSWYSRAPIWPMALPRTITCAPTSVVGFSSTGFMSTLGGRPAASAWATCARPISPPSMAGYELSDMFCALNGATE